MGLLDYHRLMYITVHVICVNVPYRPISFSLWIVQKTLYLVVDDALANLSIMEKAVPLLATVI